MLQHWKRRVIKKAIVTGWGGDLHPQPLKAVSMTTAWVSGPIREATRTASPSLWDEEIPTNQMTTLWPATPVVPPPRLQRLLIPPPLPLLPLPRGRRTSSMMTPGGQQSHSALLRKSEWKQTLIHRGRLSLWNLPHRMMERNLCMDMRFSFILQKFVLLNLLFLFQNLKMSYLVLQFQLMKYDNDFSFYLL